MSESFDVAGTDEAVASRRIANSLRDSILVGKLAPGARVYQEEIAAQFGASRLPVREAFRILESEGLIMLKSNSGAWVAKLDLEECVEIYRIRERLEPLALGESIGGLSESTIGMIEQLSIDIENSTDIDAFLKLDRQFHLLTYQACAMRSLMNMVERFWNTTQQYRRAYTALLGMEKRWIINYEHRLLVDAIKRRDGEEAERVLHGHIRRTRRELEKHRDLFEGG
ncbi:transcriptional regulator, GntR family [Burkholderia sp. D7]|nr:transcriptional regulator, GntR family [Burkholderia sp. D7]